MAPRPGVTYGVASAELFTVARKEVLHRRHEVEEKIHEKEIQHEKAVAEGKTDEEEEAQVVKELNPNYHYIHGKAYDLRPFFDQHPGGRSVLEMSSGIIDATPLFESYHAFANRPSIMKQLEKYRVKDEAGPEPMYSFQEDGFYRTLTKRVRAKFGATKDTQSVSKAVKPGFTWYIKVGVQMALWMFFYYQAFFNLSLPTWAGAICGFLAAMFMIQWGFTCFHDASHFALGARNHWMNEFFTKVWGALALWNGKTWFAHHMVYHHSFTGSEELDPDVSHALPFVCKHPDQAMEFHIFRKLGDFFEARGYPYLGWGISGVALYAFMPGMFLGQVLMYFSYRMKVPFFTRYHRLWGMPEFDTIKGYDTKLYEHLLYALAIGVHVYRFNIFVTYAYIVGANIFYAACIVADHDLVESALTNHLDVDTPDLPHVPASGSAEPEGEDAISKHNEEVESTKPDWGEVQVRNSTDFLNDSFNIFANLHGSINFQIEHHLFPGMCHMHLPHIAPIVQETCQEFGIPYTTYPKLRDAWVSFLIVMKACMTGRPLQELEQQSQFNKKSN